MTPPGVGSTTWRARMIGTVLDDLLSAIFDAIAWALAALGEIIAAAVGLAFGHLALWSLTLSGGLLAGGTALIVVTLVEGGVTVLVAVLALVATIVGAVATVLGERRRRRRDP